MLKLKTVLNCRNSHIFDEDVKQFFLHSIHLGARGRSDGSVVTWGDAVLGGDSSGVAAQLAGGVQSVTGNACAFAALKSDGSVVTWGDAESGGDSSGVATQIVI